MPMYSSNKSSLKRSCEDRSAEGLAVRESAKKRRKHDHNDGGKHADRVKCSNGVEALSVKKKKKRRGETKDGEISSSKQIKGNDDEHRADDLKKNKHKKRSGHTKHLSMDSGGSDVLNDADLFQGSVLKERKKKKAKKQLKKAKHLECSSLPRTEASEDEVTDGFTQIKNEGDCDTVTTSKKNRREKEKKKKKKRKKKHRIESQAGEGRIQLSNHSDMQTTAFDVIRVTEMWGSEEETVQDDESNHTRLTGNSKIASKQKRHIPRGANSPEQATEMSRAAKVDELSDSHSDSEDCIIQQCGESVKSRGEKTGSSKFSNKHQKHTRKMSPGYVKESTKKQKVVEICDSESSDSEENIKNKSVVSRVAKTSTCHQPVEVSRSPQKKQSHGQHTREYDEVGDLLQSTWNLSTDQIKTMKKKGLSIQLLSDSD